MSKPLSATMLRIDLQCGAEHGQDRGAESVAVAHEEVDAVALLLQRPGQWLLWLGGLTVEETEVESFFLVGLLRAQWGNAVG